MCVGVVPGRQAVLRGPGPTADEEERRHGEELRHNGAQLHRRNAPPPQPTPNRKMRGRPSQRGGDNRGAVHHLEDVVERMVEYAGRLRAIVIELHEEALVNPLEADDERGIPFSDALQQPQRRILRLP